jgi:hypothetical protein
MPDGDSGLAWLCAANTRCCAGPTKTERPLLNPLDPHRQVPYDEPGRDAAGVATKSNVALELAAAKERAQMEACLHVVRDWLECREKADAEGAAKLSTPDVQLKTPRLEPIRGIGMGA